MQEGVQCVQCVFSYDVFVQELRCLAKTIDMRSVRVKDHFTQVTLKDVAGFRGRVSTFKDEFVAGGPGADSVEMPEGLELMTEFRRRLADMNRRKEELVNAEGLFNLPLSDYPDLHYISEELDELATIYDLYSAFVDFSESMSDMLWSELDINKLTKGAEDMEKKLKKVPKVLRQRPSYEKLEVCSSTI